MSAQRISLLLCGVLALLITNAVTAAWASHEGCAREVVRLIHRAGVQPLTDEQIAQGDWRTSE